MIAEAMPTRIQKRRVVYCNDSIWEIIENNAFSKELSNSASLRDLLIKIKNDYRRIN